MQVIVSGQGVSVGQALQEYVKEKLTEHVVKYFERAIDGHVVFHKQSVFFKADIVIHDGTGTHLTIKGDAEADDVYVAFDKALVKVEHQLRKYKEKINDHHKVKYGDFLREDSTEP
jgi:ribosomal subunit interface protein